MKRAVSSFVIVLLFLCAPTVVSAENYSESERVEIITSHAQLQYGCRHFLGAEINSLAPRSLHFCDLPISRKASIEVNHPRLKFLLHCCFLI